MQGEVKIDTVDNFIGFNPWNSPIETVENQGFEPLAMEKILERAKSRLGERAYNLISNNCEHFATWCVYGQSVSLQVQAFMQLFLGGGAGGAGGLNLNQFLSS